jgi:hypothetical protein
MILFQDIKSFSICLNNCLDRRYFNSYGAQEKAPHPRAFKLIFLQHRMIFFPRGGKTVTFICSSHGQFPISPQQILKVQIFSGLSSFFKV